MSDLTRLTLLAMREGLAAGNFTSVDLIQAFQAAWEADQKETTPINGYIEFFKTAREEAVLADRLRTEGDTRPFLGVPIAVKDNILIRGKIASSASEVLKEFVAPYSATVIDRLGKAGVIFLGRTNMDEFGMGSSTEYTIYGSTHNPIDRTRSAGGSSGGSAAVVAGHQAPFALGTDTGGSVRLPAAFTGVYGYKPSYGLLSRYGVIAYGSSLDQIGLIARQPADIASIMQVVQGRDVNDMTSRDYGITFELEKVMPASLRVATLFGFSMNLMDDSVRKGFDAVKDFLNKRGASIQEVSLPLIKDSLALYYVVSLCEAASNLSRYDGVRYGMRPESQGVESLYKSFRSQKMGEEVQRRVTLGNYFLSSDNSEERFYDKAVEVLDQLKEQMHTFFGSFDVLLVPTNFVPAFKLGGRSSDPLQMYLTDLGTIFVNLVGLPAISVPAQATGLPVGVQFIGAVGSDARLLSLAQQWYERRDI